MITVPLNAQVIAGWRTVAYNSTASRAFTAASRRPMTLLDFFKQVPPFAGLPDSELEVLVKDFVMRRFEQGEAIFHQGDPGHSLYLIESGQVRIFVSGDTGQETSVVFYGAKDIFGELAVIDGLPRSASAVAMRDTVVHLLSRERFAEAMRRTPQLALNFMKALSVRVRLSTEQVESLATLNIPMRLARKLLQLAKTDGCAEADGVRIEATLTQADLASLVGATRESVNKAMGHFRQQGWISVKDGSIVILDPDALRDLCS